MRVLFVGDLNPHSRTYQRKRAFEELGHDVTAHSSTPEGSTVDGNPSLLGRVLWKIGLPSDLTQTNRTIMLTVEEQRPDVVWIEKGNTVWPKTLRIAKKHGCVRKLL